MGVGVGCPRVQFDRSQGGVKDCTSTPHGTSPDNPGGPCAARTPAPSALPGEPCRGGASSPSTASKVPPTPRTAHCPARCSARPKKTAPGTATDDFRQFFSCLTSEIGRAHI